MRQDQGNKGLQKEIEEARLEIVRDFYRSREENKKTAHQTLLQVAADIRKERLSRAILPRHKPINLADVILSHPPISTRIVPTLFGLPAQSPAPVEQPLAVQQAIPNEAEQADQSEPISSRPSSATSLHGMR